MLTDQQIIDAARECHFQIGGTEQEEWLNPPLMEFARRIEALCRSGPKPSLPPPPQAA